MSGKHIDGTQLKNMLISGANNLDNNKIMVNALNIFPVPDGDTGTNMSLTMNAAAREVKSAKTDDVYAIAQAAANGSLMGARGNSGVILSQIFRGFAQGLKGVEAVSPIDLGNAFIEGSNTAYKAIMKPTEGTILTVIRESAEYGIKIAPDYTDNLALLEEIIKKANEVLNKTPDMLPVLKNAGVVDAGGKGLLCIMEGMLHYLKTGMILPLREGEEQQLGEPVMEKMAEHTGEIEFGYCTEFFIKAKNINGDSYKDKIVTLGDSIVVAGDENLLKVHIHTNNPGKVLELALEYGELSKIKIDNMREQHSELSAQQAQAPKAESQLLKKYGVITVAMGEGIAGIFKDIGADEIIEGGQTMNPSTEDILKSVNRIHAENIVILPNNGNIILAANQAKSLSDKNIIVAPTKTIPQGIAAMMAMDFEKGAEDNAKKIERAISSVKTGLITYAVRNTTFDGINIEAGNILGIAEGKIKNVGKGVPEVSQNLLNEMIDEDSSLVSVYYGSDTTEGEAQKLADYVQNTYPDCEVEMHYGGQPLYYYILSVE